MTTFGYVLPSSSGTDVPDPDLLWPIVEAADASSLSHLWVSDHIVWWHPMYESLTLLSAVAARTSRIRLGTAVLLLALRNPVIAAKSLASIDRLSGGRLTLGVGVGGEFPPEWEAAGVGRGTRARRTDEMLDALVGMWGPGPYTKRGSFVNLESVDLQPKPAIRPPIWVGGRADAALRRVVRVADGWMGLFLTPQRYADSLSKIREWALEVGRDPESIVPSLYVWTAVSETDDAARNLASALLSGFYNVPFEKLERYAVIGSPETCARRFQEFAEAGVEHFAVAPIWPEISEEPLRMLTQQVMPSVR